MRAMGWAVVSRGENKGGQKKEREKENVFFLGFYEIDYN